MALRMEEHDRNYGVVVYKDRINGYFYVKRGAAFVLLGRKALRDIPDK